MTEFQKFALAFVVVVGFFLAGGFAFKIGQKRGYKTGYSDAMNLPHKPDTEWVERKVYIDKPVPVAVKPSGVEMYPVGTLAQLQSMIDSLRSVKPDTAFVDLLIPMEVKNYKDETYEAQVSGYRASLDWINVYQKTAYITNTVIQRKRWGFSVTAGPSVLWNGQVHAGIGATVGFSYNF